MKHKTNNKVLKIVAVLLLVIVAFPTFSSVFGAINEQYQGEKGVGTTLNIWGNEVGNILAKPIFWLINTIGSIGEYLLKTFAGVLSTDGETGIMPWADAVIYNGVPALDVNFINPASGSITSILQDILSKIYYTIFSLSITFFGIAVLIMAIKMATTAIAAEKARYKESVVNFVISLILIFSMHYFMSFVFYLNESIVKVAFNIGEVMLEGEFERLDVDSIDNTVASFYDRISEEQSRYNWFDGIDEDSEYNNLEERIDEILNDDGTVEAVAANMYTEVGDFFTKFDGDDANATSGTSVVERAVMYTMMVEAVINSKDTGELFGESLNNADNINSVIDRGYNFIEGEGEEGQIKNKLFQSMNKYFKTEDTGLFTGLNIDSTMKYSVVYYSNFDIDNVPENGKREYYELEKTVMKAMWNAAIQLQSTSENSDAGKATELEDLGNSVITQLATYFKINRYEASGELNLIGAIVYTIFVIQSIMYFFAYLKRFFYIIILAFFAPILVLFDFLSSSMGKKGDTLSKWVKEFCALVFVQSIQAFLLTMIASLVIGINNGLTNENSALSSSSAQGLGIINIIALASMAKLEDLISNMVGLKSSIADVGLSGGAKMGLHGLAGGMMTLAAAKRIGDNGKKIVGGVRNRAAANKEYKNALASKSKKLDQFSEIAGGSAAGAGGSTGGGTGSGSGAGGGGSAGGGTSSLTIKDKHKYQDALEACDAKIAEAKRKRSEATRGAIGGLLEAGGSIAGGLTGAALAGTIHAAAGDFNLADVASDAVKGAGVGDAIAAGSWNLATGVKDLGSDLKSAGGRKALQKEIRLKQEAIKEAYRNAGFDVSDL